MKRKVIQLAGKTNLVSLPISWTKKYNIKKGDEVEVIESDNKLIIKSSLEKVHQSITLDCFSMNAMSLKYCLSALHKFGYDEIILLNPTQSHTEILNDFVGSILISFIIIEHTSKKIVLKSIASDIDSEFDPTLRRAFLVSLSFADSSFEFIKSKNIFQLKSLTSMERTNDQLTSFCLRLINKGLYKDDKFLPFICTIIWSLEKIADEYKYICNSLQAPVPISNELLSSYLEVNSFFRGYYELFYKFEIIKLNELSDKRFELIKRLQNFNPSSKNESILRNHLNAIVSKLSDLSSSIFAMRHLELKEVVKDVL